MRPTPQAKREAFRRLHESGCFVIPNPFDIGSAVLLQSLGFKALASTSAGFAWSQARPDNQVTRDAVLQHLGELAAAVDIPLNADFENGFADAPDGVAESVALAVKTGIAGLSIEDSTGKADDPLYDFELAVARIKAARAAIDRGGSGVLLTARTEGFLWGRPDLDETIRRLQAFSQAGADCLYAPGIRDPAQVKAIIDAVAPKPVNVLTFGPPAAEIAALGARRISVGGRLAYVAYAEMMRVARQIAEEGSFDGLKSAAAAVNLNKIFAEQQKEGA